MEKQGSDICLIWASQKRCIYYAVAYLASFELEALEQIPSVGNRVSKLVLNNEDDKLKNIRVIYHSFLENTFSNSKCKLR